MVRFSPSLVAAPFGPPRRAYAHNLVLRVSDNGIGIDPVIADRGKDGHFGLRGMRERAARIGGNLTLGSSSNSGTEIKLVVPGDIVFRKATPVHRTLFTKIKVLFKRILSRR